MTPRRGTLLLTRPEAASEAFAATLPPDLLGALDIIVSPLIGYALTGPLPGLAGIGGVIFTSAQGVAAYHALKGPHLPLCFAVGPATAQAARAHGFDPVTGPGDAAGLAAQIAATVPHPPLLHLHGTHSRGDLAASLAAKGVTVRAAVIYDQPALPLSDSARAALTGDAPVILPLFSPRTAQLFAQAWHDIPGTAPLHVAALSPAVARSLTRSLAPGMPEAMHIARAPNADEMRTVLVALAKSARLLESGEGAQ